METVEAPTSEGRGISDQDRLAFIQSAARMSLSGRPSADPPGTRPTRLGYVLFPDEGHGFRKTVNRVKADVAVVRWFETHLKK
jgi:hypothetical protein